MDKPIVFTPQELVTVIVAISGAIVSISAAIGVLVRLYSKAREPENNQNRRIEVLEADVIELRSYLNNDNRRIKSMEHGNRIILESLQVLINHAIDGNNVTELKEKSRELNTYLYDKGFTDG